MSRERIELRASEHRYADRQRPRAGRVATDGRDTAAWIASSAQTNAGYATTSVRRNDESVIHGTVTVATATTNGSERRLAVSRRASRYAGIAAERHDERVQHVRLVEAVRGSRRGGTPARSRADRAG